MESMDALRAYIREIRIGRKVTQDELAEAMGLSRRTLIDWEMGRTEEVKSVPLFRAISYLGASAGDVHYLALAGSNAEEGRKMAQARLQGGTRDLFPLIPDDSLAMLMDIALRMKDDPYKMLELVRYGRRLLGNSEPPP
jgi:transcriptional regulator with XRE-family HTH domain